MKAFISYSSKDIITARKVAEQIRLRGWRCQSVEERQNKRGITSGHRVANKHRLQEAAGINKRKSNF